MSADTTRQAELKAALKGTGIEAHGNKLRAKVALAQGQPRKNVSTPAGWTEPHHVSEFHRWIGQVNVAVRGGLTPPPAPWAIATGRGMLHRDMIFKDFTRQVFIPAFLKRTDLLHKTKEQRIRQLIDYVLLGFRPGELNWTLKPLTDVTCRDVSSWLELRIQEVTALECRRFEGKPEPGLPDGVSWEALRSWALIQGYPISDDRRGLHGRHALREAYRHELRPDDPIGSLVPSRNELALGLWIANQVFREAVKDSQIFQLTASPIQILRLPKENKTKGRRTRSHANRAPAEITDLRRVADRLHPRSRLPFWLGSVMALRVGETFGLPVRCWNHKERQLTIEQLFGHWKDDSDTDHLVVRWLKPWVKTEASYATLTVPETMAVLITSEIELVYGHALDDPWWDEPVDISPDPLIKVNRDRPICLHPSGQWTTSAVNQFTKQVGDAARAESIDLDLSASQDGSDMAPHDLRRTVSAWIHEEQICSDRVRSAYLRHQHKGTYDDAPVTARHYTPIVASGLARLAVDLEERFVSQLLPLAAPDVAPEDSLLTTAQAWEYLAPPWSQKTHSPAVLRRHGLQPRKAPTGIVVRKECWWRRGDLDDLAAQLNGADATHGIVTGPGVMTVTQIRDLLWSGRDVERARQRLTTLERDGLVRRAPGSNRSRGYLREDVEPLNLQLRQLRSGDLMTIEQAGREFGFPASVRPDEFGVNLVVVHMNVDGSLDRRAAEARMRLLRKDADRLASRVHAQAGWTVVALSRRLDVPSHQVKRMIDVADRTYLDPDYITDTAADYLVANKDVLLGERWHIVPVSHKPAGTRWINVAEAARILGIRAPSVLARARKNYWRAVRYEGRYYVERERVGEKAMPSLFLTLDVLAERLGVPAAELPMQPSWTVEEREGDALIDPESVKEWLDSEVAGGHLFGSKEAQMHLGVGAATFSQLRDTGELRVTYQTSLGLGRYYGDAPLYTLEDLEALRIRHLPPTGWKTVPMLASERSKSRVSIRSAMKNRPGVETITDLHGERWINPGTLDDLPIIDGMLGTKDVLGLLGLPTTSGNRSRLLKLAKEGHVPGARMGVRKSTMKASMLYPTELPPDLVTQMIPDELASQRALRGWSLNKAQTAASQTTTVAVTTPPAVPPGN